LVSQVINLSNEKAFDLFKEKYKYSFQFAQGKYAVELRNIPSTLFDKSFRNTNNVFFAINELFIAGSFEDIIESTQRSVVNELVKSKVLAAIKNFKEVEKIQYQIGSKKFDFKLAHVMGILNVTPDSFSDGGKFINKDDAVTKGIEIIESGAEIIDVGGESTRPGSEPVDEDEEIRRVIPVIKEIKKQKPDVLISVDTTKSNVAKEALNSGAIIVNDISGGTFDQHMFKTIHDFNATMVIMHIKGKPKTMQASPVYTNIISEIYDYVAKQSEIASKHGIKNIIIDPGIGFGKSTADNLSLIERLEDFKSLGNPILIGLSRKSFIGNILNLPVEERDDATNVLNSICLSKGVRIIRTHNVKQAVQTCKLFNSFIKN
jgi:dihydropteroate synthase